MFYFKVKADTNTNKNDITLKFKGLKIFSYLESNPRIYQRIRTFGIDYEFEESVKDPVQSDGYREEIERIIKKLNVLDSEIYKGAQFWYDWRKYFKKFELKLSMLQKLIDVCTFKKTTYTEQGSFIYDDESKFQVNLGNVYKCNVKSFTVSVYIKNYNDYVKEVEKTELSNISNDKDPVFIEDPDGMYIKDFKGNYVIDYQPSQHMDAVHYSIDTKETKKWRPIDIEYAPETQEDIKKIEKQNQINKELNEYENELDKLSKDELLKSDDKFFKWLDKEVEDSKKSDYKLPENNKNIDKDYYKYYTNGGESFRSNFEKNKKYFEDGFENYMKNKKK